MPGSEHQADEFVGPVRLADTLGWASAALGAPMIAAPRRFLRAIGVQDDAKSVAWTLTVGGREFAATMTIIAMRHRRIGAWSRVAGDIMDLTLLASALVNRRRNTPRLIGAMGAVAGILAADFWTAVQLSRAEGMGVPEGARSTGVGAPREAPSRPTRVKTAITIKASEEDVRRAFREFPWSALDPVSLEQSGEVRFVPAPGNRGVEVHIDHEFGVPGGSLGAAALKLTGHSPEQMINDDLRRFKALIETGVEVRSDKTPEGPSSLRYLNQRPGQPLGAKS
jgi:uncharacterized membrane protein